jgi:hypothetical protein
VPKKAEDQIMAQSSSAADLKSILTSLKKEVELEK